MAIKILQCNLNHCWQAHDLLKQYMTENSIDVGFISEPITIPSARWLGSRDGRATLTWSVGFVLPMTLCFSGNGFVAGLYGDIMCISCYCSPNTNIINFYELLGELDVVMKWAGRRNAPTPLRILICGDLNAKSFAWGSASSNERGRHLERWLAQWDLCVVNEGSNVHLPSRLFCY